jgi:hypothetical protein
MNGVLMERSRISEKKRAGFSQAVTPAPGDLENRVLRQAVRENLVSFPSQVPVFERQSRPDLQQKLVVLYFLRGWTMDDIAKRYGLGRQRMGQILTAWRNRAVKEGYIQAIAPEHPIFRRARLEQTRQFAETLVAASSILEQGPNRAPALNSASIASATEVGELPPVMPDVTELKGSILAEELCAIVGVLDNQLRLCSKPLNGSIDSCEQLLVRARTLCVLLESQLSAIDSNDEWRTTSMISAAKELFQRFQEYAVERSSSLSKPVFGQGSKSKQVRPLSSVTNRRNMPPRTSQRVAVSV